MKTNTRDVTETQARGGPGTSSEPLPVELSHSDILVLAQSGDPGGLDLLPRLGGVGPMTVLPNESAPVARAALRAASRYGYGLEMAEEIAGALYAAILDPNIARFDPVRGSVDQYLMGLSLNAVRAALPAKAVPIPGGLAAEASGGLTFEEQDCVCWVCRTAPDQVRRAFGRLKGGRTLDQAAEAVGTSRRSLKRAIDGHIDHCRGMILGTA